MKIYISNIPISNITKNIHKLSEYMINPNGNNIIELHSLDYGLHIIQEDKIYRHEPEFNPQYEIIREFNGYDLLIDKSKSKLLPVVSQMPINYIITKFKVYEYKIDKKTDLKFIIKCIKTPTTHIKNINNCEEVCDFYFEYENTNLDLTDIFFQDQINMFLSHLN